MTKNQAKTSENEKSEAQRKERLIDAAKSTNADLDDALDDSFPASDPPSMTRRETEVGPPSKSRTPDSDR